MAKNRHGMTASGVPITDELVAELATKAATGYDVDEMLRRRPNRRRVGARTRRPRTGTSEHDGPYDGPSSAA